MKRTKSPQNQKANISYAVDEEPIVLSKPLLDTFLSQPKPADLISLYCFYYYTAKWQKTNQPKATTGYVAKGLVWGTDRVRNAKKGLIKLKLIEDIVTRGEGNRVVGHYIKVNFIWKTTTIKDYFHPQGFPESGNAHTVEGNEGNALSSNNINALSTNTSFSDLGNSTKLNNYITPNQFNKFWKIYPKKTDKGKALTKWNKICSKPPKERPRWKDIRVAIHRQKESERWQDKRFIPNPTTWLNQNRWLDDPEEMKNYNRNESINASGSRSGSSEHPTYIEYDEQL